MKKNKGLGMVPNGFGIMVKKCCASCTEKCLDDFGGRKCCLTGRQVKATHGCKEWSMCERLKALGCQRGMVQRREYQLTLMAVRASESRATQMGLTITRKSLEVIRKEFETEYGTRFCF